VNCNKKPTNFFFFGKLSKGVMLNSTVSTILQYDAQQTIIRQSFQILQFKKYGKLKSLLPLEADKIKHIKSGKGN
jgi:hypothetical protein